MDNMLDVMNQMFIYLGKFHHR